ncbi:hypothetical protein EYF80_061378 [Liparis tanakae]|uniref:Uncharacterized protein n=1 Tax=Liparis tanakae TaxID=230148 RepID=A0A4Z2EJ61_9TELE|nr:hypothetical protein EYF80_061378 [Liparis tanakae]
MESEQPDMQADGPSPVCGDAVQTQESEAGSLPPLKLESGAKSRGAGANGPPASCQRGLHPRRTADT